VSHPHSKAALPIFQKKALSEPWKYSSFAYFL